MTGAGGTAYNNLHRAPPLARASSPGDLGVTIVVNPFAAAVTPTVDSHAGRRGAQLAAAARRRLRNRWWLAAYLATYPQLVAHRRPGTPAVPLAQSQLAPQPAFRVGPAAAAASAAVL